MNWLSYLQCTHLACHNVILIVVVITMCSATTLASAKVQPECVQREDRYVTAVQGQDGGPQVFQWTTWSRSVALNSRPMWQHVSSDGVTAVFDFQGNCLINVTGIEYFSSGACELTVISEE
eukprot:scpid104320/ scgid12358/ 